MKFQKLTGSVVATLSVLSASLPVYAGPFELQRSQVFGNSTEIRVSPAAVGNATGTVSPSTSPAGSNTASPENAVGNSEINGLGDHNSWVDTGVLAEDPRALCSDVGLGNNTTSSSTQVASNSSSSSRVSESRAQNSGGGGGFSVFGIGANGSGSSASNQNSSRSNDSRMSESESRQYEASTVAMGRNCDAFVESAAARDMNYEDNLTERYRIRVGRRGEQVDNLLEDR